LGKPRTKFQPELFRAVAVVVRSSSSLSVLELATRLRRAQKKRGARADPLR